MEDTETKTATDAVWHFQADCGWRINSAEMFAALALARLADEAETDHPGWFRPITIARRAQLSASNVNAMLRRPRLEGLTEWREVPYGDGKTYMSFRIVR